MVVDLEAEVLKELKDLTESLSKPNLEHNNVPKCPYAKQEWEKGRVPVIFKYDNDESIFLKKATELINSDLDVIVIIDFAFDLDVKTYSDKFKDLNKSMSDGLLKSKDVYFMVSHPYQEISNGVIGNRTKHHGTVFVQRLSALQKSSFYLRKLGYYKDEHLYKIKFKDREDYYKKMTTSKINNVIKFIDTSVADYLLHHVKQIEPMVGRVPDRDVNGPIPFGGTTQVPYDPVMESLLTYMQPTVEKHYGKELMPTYSFWRTYYKGQCCPPHKDRPSCEVSVTLSLGASDESCSWEFYVNNKKFKTMPGEGVIYKGCEQEHWRNDLEYDWHSQVFLHYVEKDGKNKEYVYDKRGGLYVPAED